MRLRLFVHSVIIAILLIAVFAATALAAPAAHDQPAGDNWIMADWMLYSTLIFMMAALCTFLIALKRGMFHNIEDAKYYILSIPEQDFYTPDWAKEDKDAT